MFWLGSEDDHDKQGLLMYLYLKICEVGWTRLAGCGCLGAYLYS